MLFVALMLLLVSFLVAFPMVAGAASVNLTATKQVKYTNDIGEMDISGWNFTFGIWDGESLVATATNGGTKDVVFPELSFETTGTYTFEITELNDYSEEWAEGWTFDTSEYRAVITVTQSGNELVASVEYPDGYPSFVNMFDDGIWNQKPRTPNTGDTTSPYLWIALFVASTILVTGLYLKRKYDLAG